MTPSTAPCEPVGDARCLLAVSQSRSNLGVWEPKPRCIAWQCPCASEGLYRSQTLQAVLHSTHRQCPDATLWHVAATPRKKVKPRPKTDKCRQKISSKEKSIPEDAGGREKNRKCHFLRLHGRALMQDIDAPTLTRAKNGYLFSEDLPR